MSLDAAYSYVDSNIDRFISEFQKYVQQESISAQNIGMEECSKLVEGMMKDLGITTKIYPLENGAPIVYGELLNPNSDKTLLLYSHYDVQPPEPLDLWNYPPFGAEIDDGKIYGRGASDAKGNGFTYLKAVETLQKTPGTNLPNIKFLYEGEEEIASKNLPGFINANKEMLKADAAISADGSLDENGAPRLNLGLKGLLYVELNCQTATGDAHSMRAPLVANPAWRLVWALNTIKDQNDRILIDGWYDNVTPLTQEEKDLLGEIDFDEKEIQQQWGVSSFLGNPTGTNALEQWISQPTATICGFGSGYTGDGSKTVLPSKAKVKIDFRLVPNMNPDELFERVKSHLIQNGFNDITVTKIGQLYPSKTPVTSPIAKVVRDAAEKVYERKPSVYPNSAGSGPDFVFTKLLGLNSVWTGCSPPASNIHAPNEFTTIRDINMGAKYAATVLHYFA